MVSPLKNKSKRFIIIFIILFNSNFSFSQSNNENTSVEASNEFSLYKTNIDFDDDSLKSKWGLYFNYGLNLLNADFKYLPGTYSCCANYGNAISPGFSAGGLFELPLSNKFQINFRAGFNQSNILHKVNQPTFIINGESFDGNIEHKLEAKMALIDLSIMPSYRIWENLFVTAGVKLGYFVHNKFTQIERITQPLGNNIYFEETGLNYRNYYTGKIQDINKLQVYGSIGLYYDFPITRKKTFWISPEIYYTYGFTKIVKDLNWSAHFLRGGIALKYQAPPPPPPPPAAPVAPPLPDYPLPIEPPALAASVEMIQLDSLGRQVDNVALKIEDFISLNMRPLLNYVFFDSLSAEIPSRYFIINKDQAQNFDEFDLKDMDVIPTYYYMLNIFGKRLQKYPDATITLTGTNSNEGAEKNNKELSMQRAEKVKDYFVNIWGVDESRIKLKALNLPNQPSNKDEIGGNEENRRVEITSDDNRLTEPVLTIDTLRKIPKTTIVFHPKANTDVGINKWHLNILQNGSIIKSFEGSDVIPESLEWLIDDKSKTNPTKRGKLTYNLVVMDKLGNEVSTSTKDIQVDQLTIDKKRVEGISDKEFEYYSLILFDYGKSKLGTEHKNTADFVKNRITDKSKVTIIGYTDSMGKEEINKRISTARANEFAKRIKIKNADIYGIGEAELLYDNSLPEGRFYCRTVKINIETPIDRNGN